MLVSAALIARTVWFLDRGFDFTDDSFYLMTIQRPSEYKWNYGLFGFALKPLFVIAGESIAGFRRIGAVILVGLGAAIGLVVLNKAKLSWREPAALQVLAVCSAVPLGYYSLWLTSPSYNWLALAGGLVLFIAVLLLYRPGPPAYSAFCAAAAGTVAALGRPHSAVSFGVIYFAAVLLALPTMRARITQMVWAAGATILAVAIVALLLPLDAVLSQIKEYNAMFGTSHPVHFSTLDRQLAFLLQGKTWFLSVLLFAAILFMKRSGREIPGRLTPLLYAAALAIISAAALSQLLRPREYDFGIKATAVAFSVLTLSCLRKTIDVRLIMLLALAAIIPWAATSGSSNTVSLTFAQTFGLSIAVAFVTSVLALEKTDAMIAAASAVALCLTFSALGFGLNSPYRLARPIEMQVVPTAVGWGSTLKLDRKTSEFVEALRNATKASGHCRGGFAMDLSGSSPGTVFVVDGKMPVFPWIFGGYSISDHFAREYFKRLEPDHLKRSWLFTKSSGSFSIEEMQALGVDFTAYRLVLELRNPVDDSLVKVHAPLQQVPCPTDKGQ